MASSQDEEYLDTYVNYIVENANRSMTARMSKARNGCIKHGGKPGESPKLKVRFKDIDEDDEKDYVDTDYVVVESFGVPNLADFESSTGDYYQYEQNYNDYEYSTRIARSMGEIHLQDPQDRTTNQETDYNPSCRNNEKVSDINTNHHGLRNEDAENLNIIGDGETLVASSCAGSKVRNSSMAPRHFRNDNSNRNDSLSPREECGLNYLDDPQCSAEPCKGIPLNPFIHTDDDSYSHSSADSEENRGDLYITDDSTDQTEEEFIRLEQQIEQLYYHKHASKNKSSDQKNQINNMDSKEPLRLHTTEKKMEEYIQLNETAKCITAENDQVSQQPDGGAMCAKHACPSRRTREDRIDSLEQKSAELADNFRKILQYEIAREAAGSDVNELQDIICQLRIKIDQERKEKEAMMEFFIEKERESVCVQRHLQEEIGTLHKDLTRTIESKIEEDVYQQSRLARELMKARTDHDRYLVATLERQNKINELAIAVKSQQMYIQTLEETIERMRSTLNERKRNSTTQRLDLKGISPTEGASYASNNLLDVLHCDKGRFMGGLGADGTLCALQLFGISDINEENEPFEVFGAMDPLNLPYIRQQLRACAELQEEISQESC